MILKKYPMEAKNTILPGDKLDGTVTLPQGSKIVHVGVEPPNGEMFAYAETPSVETPAETVDLRVIRCDDSVPEGYEYMGHFMVVPILFVYRKRTNLVVHG